MSIILFIIVLLLLAQIAWLTKRLSMYKAWEIDVSKEPERLTKILHLLSKKERNLASDYKKLLQEYNELLKGINKYKK